MCIPSVRCVGDMHWYRVAWAHFPQPRIKIVAWRGGSVHFEPSPGDYKLSLKWPRPRTVLVGLGRIGFGCGVGVQPTAGLFSRNLTPPLFPSFFVMHALLAQHFFAPTWCFGLLFIPILTSGVRAAASLMTVACVPTTSSRHCIAPPSPLRVCIAPMETVL